MKICWDNLEGVNLTKSGTFRKGNNTYVYKEACIECGEPYLAEKHRKSKFCSVSCAIGGKNHYLYGKTPSAKTRGRMSIAQAGKNNGMYGKKHSDEARKKMSIARIGKTISSKVKEKISKSLSESLNYNYKGGVAKLGLTTYDTHKDTLSLYEDIRKQKGTEVLEVKCAYCGKWFTPTYASVKNRLIAVNTLNKGERRLYCSENCKQVCPTYKRKMYPRDFKHTTSREVSTYLRQMVFERDNWTCQICGKTIKECQLHCHHMDPATQNPMFQNDVDSCITLCKGCHKMVHSRRGCRYIDLICKNKKGY